MTTASLLVILVVIQGIGLVVLAISGSKTPARTLVWMTACTLLPLIGFCIYASLYGQIPKRQRLRWKDAHTDAHPETGIAKDLILGLKKFTSPVLSAEVGLIFSGDEFYTRLIEELRRAKRTIDIEFYTFRCDAVGRPILDVLLERARAGVQVRFVRDGMGSLDFPHDAIDDMASAGILSRVFFPVRFPYLRRTLNHRDHCKLVIIDEEAGYMGGMNVGLEYTGHKEGVGTWRDTQARITGQAVPSLTTLFETNWKISTPDAPSPRLRRMGTKERTVPTVHVGGRGRIGEGDDRHYRRGGRFQPDFSRTANEWERAVECSGQCSVEFAAEDEGTAPGSPTESLTESLTESSTEWPTESSTGSPKWKNGLTPLLSLPTKLQYLDSGPDHSPAIRDAFFLCITRAQKNIRITTPYFLPGHELMTALSTAAARGVKVQLLIPEWVDHRWIGFACQTYYQQLLEAGLEVYLWQPGVLHAKLMTVDDEVSIVGAANYDPRSLRLNYEQCFICYGKAVAEALRIQFHRDLRHARKLTVDDLNVSVWQNVMNHAARLAAPLM